MQHKTLICCLLIILPGLLIGQELKEIKSESEMLANPDKYPVSIYLKLGLPFGAMALNTGNSNIRQQLEAAAIELSRTRAYSLFEIGLRYKRIYVDLGVDIPVYELTFFDRPVRSFTVDSYQTAGWGNVGVSILQNRNTALLLRLGIGEFEAAHEITSFGNTDQLDFDQLFPDASSPKTTLIFNRNTFIDIGLEMWRGIAKSSTSSGETLRIGYRRGLKASRWEASGRRSINAPLDRMGEIYFQFGFSIGYNFPQKYQ
ncbi:MAG: hypothetical protein R8P61_09075 [Bacteroidia bacterium]|nr:hypothetical protein [Bacteroidia bacterium]